MIEEKLEKIQQEQKRLLLLYEKVVNIKEKEQIRLKLASLCFEYLKIGKELRP